MKKISCLSASFSGNKGASAMLISAIKGIRNKYPDAIFYIFSPFPGLDKRFTSKNIEIFSGSPANLMFKIIPLSLLFYLFKLFKVKLYLCREIKALHESDIVMDLSGISFADKRELFLIFNIAILLPALLLRKKVIKASQALGSFNNFINRRAAKLILPRLHLIIARGNRTKEHLKQLGLKNVISGSDLTFSMPISEKNNEKVKKYLDYFNSEKKIVGVSPSSVVERQCRKINIDYIKEMIKFISFLIKDGYQIIIIPHSYAVDRKVKKNKIIELIDLAKKPRGDLPVCRNIYNNIGLSRHCRMIEEDLSAEELRFIIGKCDYYIASRFHSMISALSMVVPVLVCGWGHKYREVLEDFDLSEFSFSYRDIGYEKMVNKFNYLVNNKELIENKINIALPGVIKSSKKYLDHI